MLHAPHHVLPPPGVGTTPEPRHLARPRRSLRHRLTTVTALVGATVQLLGWRAVEVGGRTVHASEVARGTWRPERARPPGRVGVPRP